MIDNSTVVTRQILSLPLHGGGRLANLSLIVKSSHITVSPSGKDATDLITASRLLSASNISVQICSSNVSSPYHTLFSLENISVLGSMVVSIENASSVAASVAIFALSTIDEISGPVYLTMQGNCAAVLTSAPELVSSYSSVKAAVIRGPFVLQIEDSFISMKT